MLICPICHKDEFDRVENGLLIKKYVFTCRGCHTRLEQTGQGQKATFRITAVSPDYTNCVALFDGMRWSLDELTKNEAKTYSDAQLASIVQGDIPAEILEEAEEIPPFPLEEGEELIFALDNVFFFEDRLWKSSQTTRFSFRETIRKWQTVKNLPEPQRRDITETLDNGSLYITTRRYSFTGMSHAIDEPFTKISLILPFQDGMGISRSNSAKMEFYKGGYHWPLVAAVMRGLIRRSTSPVDAPR
jgi:ribosomal protein S3AE